MAILSKVVVTEITTAQNIQEITVIHEAKVNEAIVDAGFTGVMAANTEVGEAVCGFNNTALVTTIVGTTTV